MAVLQIPAKGLSGQEKLAFINQLMVSTKTFSRAGYLQLGPGKGGFSWRIPFSVLLELDEACKNIDEARTVHSRDLVQQHLLNYETADFQIISRLISLPSRTKSPIFVAIFTQLSFGRV